MTGCNMEGKTYKEQLSKHVENIFRNYATPGLHICDIATGGGKSYTIGKLTCEYYPKHFDRIIILCVQNKLVESMNKEIDRFIENESSLISPSDKLVIENNTEVIKKAFKNGSFQKLLDEMHYQLGEQKRKYGKLNELQYNYSHVRSTYEGLSGIQKNYDANGNNDYIQKQFDEGEANLRRYVRKFFDAFKKHLENTKQPKKVSLESRFPSLVTVYPQVACRNKKVLLMTVHKAMYGIDPILSEKIRLQDMAEKNRRTLILFDESDQAAIAIRDTIITQSIDNAGGSNRFAKGYNGYLQYKNLIDTPEYISNEYYGRILENCLNKAQKITETNWKKRLGKVAPYKNIFLGNIEELETYRRGVFFSGPAFRLNISPKGDKTNSYICYKSKDRHFTLLHLSEEDTKHTEYDIILPLDKFLKLVIDNTTAIKSQLREIISKSLQKSRENFKEEEKKIAANIATTHHYLGFPTLEREIHTLFSRFETTSEYQFEQQINEFITNRKNIIVGEGNKIKLPDNSVYSQGVQLYQEEIDERDNLHRVRLSCREIATTPEKIIVDLVNTDGTSVVLCSATASCWSVVNNYDIKYLKQVLGEKFHALTKENRDIFDNLVDKTYPKGHKIDIVPLEKYNYTDTRENAIRLPDKYRKMFSADAINEELPDKWFKITCRGFKKTGEDIKGITFQLYRLFQFIEAYHWFITHDDIHSMIYFQNRTGYKDKDQINVLSCLIDGSYKDMSSLIDDELPTDWENCHIRISKDWEDVESNILSNLSKDKDAKLMLVSAYGSFKAGANMQYGIPEGLDYIAGDNWEAEGKQQKKDWDAIYVQSPTGYLMMNEDGNETTYEKSLYNAMLKLMMLYERSCLSEYEVKQSLYDAISNKLWFSEDNNSGAIKDKAAWAQTTVEQAIGRLCRTRNKPHTTYILFDESMKVFFDTSNMEKSLTKEFRTLAEYIFSHQAEMEEKPNPDEVIRCNSANQAQSQLNRMRNIALPHLNEEDEFDYDYEEDIPHRVKVHQIMNQSYKRTIITKPVISSLEELNDIDKQLPFIFKCYGMWGQDENGCYSFSCDTKHNNRICTSKEGKTYTISPSYVRLDTLMKNPIIKEHFEKNGFATNWKEGGLILHPRILATDYAGEIGEEAFKAILLYYTNCTEENLKHLEGKDYELADFVIMNSDGSYKIAFDVKNMNPKVDHKDKLGDIPTTKKRQLKQKRLGCEVITVNILQIDANGMDEIREIGGIIDIEGNIIPSAIERIKQLVN